MDCHALLALLVVLAKTETSFLSITPFAVFANSSEAIHVRPVRLASVQSNPCRHFITSPWIATSLRYHYTIRNDGGVSSPGLFVLANAVKQFI